MHSFSEIRRISCSYQRTLNAPVPFFCHLRRFPEDDFLASPQSKLTDGIIIATSHSSHYEVAMKAMGKFHIFMEKPMTTDLAEADALTKTALRCDKIFMLNNTANFRPSAEKVHDVIKSALNCRKYCVQKTTKRITKEIPRVSVGRVIDQLSTVPR